MNINLVNLLCEVPRGELGGYFAEEFAVAIAFCETGAAEDKAELLQQRAREWSEVVVPPERPTEGSRQQPLLRQMIDELQGEHTKELQWDELTFLCAAFKLMSNVFDRTQFNRPLELLEPYAARLQEVRSAQSPIEALPNLRKRVMVVTEADIRQAPHIEIRKFAGVDMAFRGPLLRHRGFLKVVGSVPDSCAVVVEEGSCYVNGFVQGKIAVTGNCEVRETIAGMVVSSQRAVRARGIINPAVVIAKTGRVGCFMSQSPKLVYAGNQIRIVDSAVQGVYYAPRIRVGQCIEGGEWHISAAMRCTVFRNSESRPLKIVFRRSLSCLDYGEAVPPPGRIMLSSCARLSNHSEYLEQILNAQRDDLDLLAENILTYLSCGEQVQELVAQLEAVKGRILILDRIISGSTLIKHFASERVRAAGAPSGSGGGESEGDSELNNSLRDLDADLRSMVKNEEGPQELQRTWESVMAQFNTIGQQASASKVARIMEFVQRSLLAWSKQRAIMVEELAVLRQKLAGSAGELALVERARESKNAIGVLHQVLKAALSKPPDNALGVRARSAPVTRMVRSLHQKNERVHQYDQELGRERQRIRELAQQLDQQFHLPLPGQEECIQVAAQFEGGGTVCYNGHRQAVDDGLLESVQPIVDSAGEIITYRCKRGGEISLIEEDCAIVIEE